VGTAASEQCDGCAQQGVGSGYAHHEGVGLAPEDDFDPYEHPKVREARLAARTLADQMDLAQLPGMDLAPPPERGLVCYDDL
jgi:hypothetical protein